MQFTVWVKNEGNPNSLAWPERFNKRITDPEKWAEETIKEFNSSLREGELAREVVRVVVEPNTVPIEHRWRKLNLVTLPDHTDRYVCEECGAKGTRFGLSAISCDNTRQISCIETTDPKRQQKDPFAEQVFQSYLKGKKRRATVGVPGRTREVMSTVTVPEINKLKAKIVRAVEWTKRLRKPLPQE